MSKKDLDRFEKLEGGGSGLKRIIIFAAIIEAIVILFVVYAKLSK